MPNPPPARGRGTESTPNVEGAKPGPRNAGIAMLRARSERRELFPRYGYPVAAHPQPACKSSMSACS